MASRRLLSSLFRSSSHRSVSKSPFSTPNPKLSSPSSSSVRRASPYSYLLTRAAEYATSAAAASPPQSPRVSDRKKAGGKITNEFTGKGAIGQVCQVIGAVVGVRFDEGLPPILTALEAVKKSDIHPLEEKKPDDEPLVFANKMEAKNAFKALLESVNVQSDWTREQTMREIVNDIRYNALKTLGERKQAFNEYLC